VIIIPIDISGVSVVRSALGDFNPAVFEPVHKTIRFINSPTSPTGEAAFQGLRFTKAFIISIAFYLSQKLIDTASASFCPVFASTDNLPTRFV
jgi:hypothetical protein